MKNGGMLARIALSLVCGAIVLSSCTMQSSTEDLLAREELLTAAQVGGGEEQLSVEWEDVPAATRCGPDMTTEFPVGRHVSQVARYVSGQRTIMVGVWERSKLPLKDFPARMASITASEPCVKGVAAWGGEASSWGVDWRVTPIDFGPNTHAFRSLEWGGDIPLTKEPDLERNQWIRAAARAYGVVDDKIVMVRIDLENVSVEPPSEEELRALWDAQVAKVRYFKALEHAQELLTPQSGQTNK